MKIGLLTFHRSFNYGAVIQAFALQEYLKRMKHDVTVIDYWPEYHDLHYKLMPDFRKRSFFGKTKSIILAAIAYTRYMRRKKNFVEFMKNRFDVSNRIKYSTGAKLENLEYDIVIYGSDQIWRKNNFTHFKGYNDVYFGAFLPKVNRKVSYAASMGVIDPDDKDLLYLKKMLQNFTEISVRETALKCLIDSIIGSPVKLVLDPAFLLDKDDWSELACSYDLKKKKKYILFYQLTPSPEAVDLTNKLRVNLECQVIELRGRVDALLFGKRYKQTAGPEDFISLIKNAEFVVSNAFHGIVFAIIFQKQFYSLGMGKDSGRVESLLAMLNISERLIQDVKDIDFNKKIDYDEVNIRVEGLKSESRNFLRNSLFKG